MTETTVRGGYLCGAVRFSASGPPRRAAANRSKRPAPQAALIGVDALDVTVYDVSARA